jgi:hypothetical protein
MPNTLPSFQIIDKDGQPRIRLSYSGYPRSTICHEEVLFFSGKRYNVLESVNYNVGVGLESNSHSLFWGILNGAGLPLQKANKF